MAINKLFVVFFLIVFLKSLSSATTTVPRAGNTMYSTTPKVQAALLYGLLIISSPGSSCRLV